MTTGTLEVSPRGSSRTTLSSLQDSTIPPDRVRHYCYNEVASFAYTLLRLASFFFLLAPHVAMRVRPYLVCVYTYSDVWPVRILEIIQVFPADNLRLTIFTSN